MLPSFRFLAVLVSTALLSAIPAEAQTAPKRIVVFGDSLSSGFLIPTSQAFPAVLEAGLRQRGLDVTVANAAVAGDTTAGGLARLDRDVPPGTDGVILELGANDMLQRYPAPNLEGSLQQLVGRFRARGIPVLLVGVRLSATSGADVAGYEAAYRSVARAYGVAYFPDIYAGLASNPGYTIFDRTHPSPAGVQLMVGRILPTVVRFVGNLDNGPRRRRPR